MKTRYIILALLMTLGVVTNCSGQVIDIKEQNRIYLDSIRQVVETHFCHGEVKYPENYDEKEVDKAIAELKFLSFIVENDITPRQMDSALSKIKLKGEYEWVKKEEELKGLLRILTVRTQVEYLSVTIKFVYIDEFLVLRKFEFAPKPETSCLAYGQVPNFKILTEVFAQYIDYPIRMIDSRDIRMKKFSNSNLAKASAKRPDYQFFLNRISTPPRNWVDSLLLNHYDPDNSSCCYNYSKGERGMVRLIREAQYDVIRDLVFSPNYYYAINAMEAAIYLSSTGKILLDDRLKGRMAELKSQKFTVMTGGSDVHIPRDGYVEIRTSDEAVVRKYERSLREREPDDF